MHFCACWLTDNWIIEHWDRRPQHEKATHWTKSFLTSSTYLFNQLQISYLQDICWNACINSPAPAEYVETLPKFGQYQQVSRSDLSFLKSSEAGRCPWQVLKRGGCFFPGIFFSDSGLCMSISGIETAEHLVSTLLGPLWCRNSTRWWWQKMEWYLTAHSLRAEGLKGKHDQCSSAVSLFKWCMYRLLAVTGFLRNLTMNGKFWVIFMILGANKKTFDGAMKRTLDQKVNKDTFFRNGLERGLSFTRLLSSQHRLFLQCMHLNPPVCSGIQVVGWFVAVEVLSPDDAEFSSPLSTSTSKSHKTQDEYHCLFTDKSSIILNAHIWCRNTQHPYKQNPRQWSIHASSNATIQDWSI